MTDPVGRQVDPAAVSIRLNDLFDQLFPKDPELGLGRPAGIYLFCTDLFQTHFSIKATISTPIRRKTLTLF